MDDVEAPLAVKMKSVTSCLPTVSQGFANWMYFHELMLTDLMVVFGNGEGVGDDRTKTVP